MTRYALVSWRAVAMVLASLTTAACTAGLLWAVRREIAISPDGSNGLSSVLLEATFDGSHASGLNFLKILADSAPTIFVEELDGLPADGDRAQWRLKGRIYCAIRLGQ
ncbi:MAG: hypothetical protein K0R83_2968 [Caulobacter sp.]|nr:hypothetical protein [Caulobacter sp.]